MKKIILLFIATLFASSLYAHGGKTNKEGCHSEKKTGEKHCHSTKYYRKAWGYVFNKSLYNSRIGFYTNRGDEKIHTDHVVALKDAHDSGGKDWSLADKKKFANDIMNQVLSLEHVNRSLKNDFQPKEFINNMAKKKRYNFADGRKCEYLKRYIIIKKKYDLNFNNNDKKFLLGEIKQCKSKINKEWDNYLSIINSQLKKSD